jgi:hypothetical protein
MTSVGAVGSADVAQSLAGRTVSTAREPPGNCFSSSASGAVRLIQATQSFGCSTATWRSWYGATSGPGGVRQHGVPIGAGAGSSGQLALQSHTDLPGLHDDIGILVRGRVQLGRHLVDPIYPHRRSFLRHMACMTVSRSAKGIAASHGRISGIRGSRIGPR